MRIFALLLLLPIVCPAQTVKAARAHSSQISVLHLLESRYANARTLQVKFLERYTQNARFVRAESGTAYFLRPGKMRWDYQAPEKNTFLVDGKYAWFYSPSDRTAIRTPAKQSGDWHTPLAFLVTHLKLSRLCASITTEQSNGSAEAGDVKFRCELRDLGDKVRPVSLRASDQAEGAHRNTVQFEVSPDGELKRIVVSEGAGSELEFSFSDWKWNPPLEKSMFEFTPPRGVAIVNGLLSDTPGMRQ